MKKIILIEPIFSKFVNYEALLKEQAFELIGIFKKLSENEFLTSLTEEEKKSFKRIYYVELDISLSTTYMGIYNESQVREIILNELKEANKSDVELVCLGEDNLLLTAKLRKEILNRGPDPNLWNYFRDKLLMKERLREKGILVPRFLKLDLKKITAEAPKYFQILKEKIGAPFILKPVSQASSFGVFDVGNIDQFENASRLCKENNCEYEAEEKIMGDLYHVDIIIYDKKVVFFGCNRLINQPLDFLRGFPVGSILIEDDDLIKNQLFLFSLDCVKALKDSDGVFHIELFRNSKNKLVFLEVAARSPGALCVPVYRDTYNVNFPEIHFKIQSALNVSVEKKFSGKYYTFIIYPYKRMTINNFSKPEIKSEFKIEYFVKIGQKINNARALYDRACYIYLWNSDYRQLKEDLFILEDFEPLQAG